MVPELRELILNRAAGNPLFMEELTHSLLENGSIKQKNDKYVLSDTNENIQVPETIQGIIAARMDRLEDNLKRTMQVASVIGRDFAFRILNTITDMREDLKAYLLNLQGLEFIYEKRMFPELEYIFKHDWDVIHLIFVAIDVCRFSVGSLNLVFVCCVPKLQVIKPNEFNIHFFFPAKFCYYSEI